MLVFTCVHICHSVHLYVNISVRLYVCLVTPTIRPSPIPVMVAELGDFTEDIWTGKQPKNATAILTI